MKSGIALFLMFFSVCAFGKSNKNFATICPKTSVFNYKIFFKEYFFYGLYGANFGKMVKDWRQYAGKSAKVVLFIVPYKKSKTAHQTICNNIIGKDKSILVETIYCNDGYNVGELCFSLLSDTGKKITVYGVGPYGFHDASQFRIKHRYTVGVLIDEKNQIVSILDNVQGAHDIFKAFGV